MFSHRSVNNLKHCESIHFPKVIIHIIFFSGNKENFFIIGFDLRVIQLFICSTWESCFYPTTTSYIYLRWPKLHIETINFNFKLIETFWNNDRFLANVAFLKNFETTTRNHINVNFPAFMQIRQNQREEWRCTSHIYAI